MSPKLRTQITRCCTFRRSIWNGVLSSTVPLAANHDKLSRRRNIQIWNVSVGSAPPCTSTTGMSHIKSIQYAQWGGKWSRCRPGVAQRVGRSIALLFHGCGTRRGWVVSVTPRPHFTPGKTRYPLYRRLCGPQGRSGRAENLVPTGIRSRTGIATDRSQSLYRLSYRAHTICTVWGQNYDRKGAKVQRGP